MSTAPPPEPTERRKGPRFLGRYELIGELARGGMGTVYLARHAGEAGFQRLFAIKLLHPHLVEETGFVDMLRDEARIAARIHHPNVVAIVDLGTEGDFHYVVMEYVEGPSFGTLLKRNKEKRPADLIVSIVIDTLEGLHAAHTLKDDEGEDIHLVHRDVSPQNILVGVDGGGRITDFGIAKAEARITSTQPGIRKGKLQFMSPEQIKDSEALDQRTDVWAAGAVLWSALTGKNLFRGESDAATLHNVLMKEIVAPSTEGLKPPPFFDEIILRALSREQAARFPTALDMADELRKAAAANGLLGSRQQAARWVIDTFGEELERRRKAIREVARRRADQQDLTDSSQINVLPPLPSMTTTGGILMGGAMTSTQSTGTLSGSTVQPAPGSPSAGPPPGIPLSQPPDFKQRTNRLWMAIAIVGIALVAIVALVVRSPSEAKSGASTVHEILPVSPGAPEPAKGDKPAGLSAVARPAEPGSPSLDQAVPDAQARALDPDDRKGPRVIPASPVSLAAGARRLPVRPLSTPEPREIPKSEPKEAVAPAAPKQNPPPPPLPTPAPTDDFEKNPYMRR